MTVSPKKHIALRNPLLPTSDRTFSSQNQQVAPKSAMMHFFNHCKQHRIRGSNAFIAKNKRSVCWWLAVKVSYWCKKASSAGLHCASFEKWKKLNKTKKRCWNKSSHLSHIRPDVRITLNQMRGNKLAVLWLNTKIDILQHVMRIWQEETRHFHWSRDVCSSESAPDTRCCTSYSWSAAADWKYASAKSELKSYCRRSDFKCKSAWLLLPGVNQCTACTIWTTGRLQIGSCGFLTAHPVIKQTNQHIKNCTWNITL